MDDKLKELDIEIKTIYNDLSQRNDSTNYLIIITADHGMTNEGRHGSNSLHETLIPLIFLDAREKVNETSRIASEPAEQIDIASTLCTLFGLPFPMQSKGRVIRKVLQQMNMSNESQVCTFFNNALQMIRFAKDDHIGWEQFKLLSDLHKQTIQYNRIKEKASELCDQYEKLCLRIQSSIAFEPRSPSLLLVTSATFLASNSIMILLATRATENLKVLGQLCKRHWTLFLALLTALPIGYSFTSSFIRTEHQYWGN